MTSQRSKHVQKSRHDKSYERTRWQGKAGKPKRVEPERRDRQERSLMSKQIAAGLVVATLVAIVAGWLAGPTEGVAVFLAVLTLYSSGKAR